MTLERMCAQQTNNVRDKGVLGACGDKGILFMMASAINPTQFNNTSLERSTTASRTYISEGLLASSLGLLCGVGAEI